MSSALVIARSIIQPIVRAILINRENERLRTKALSHLINVRIADDFKKRALKREIQAATDSVAQRIEPLLDYEWSGLTDGDKSAVAFAVAETFQAVELTDTALFDDDVDARLLERRIKEQAQESSVLAGLGEPARALFFRVTSECCALYIQLIVHVAPFKARAIAELLARSTSLARRVELVLERIPARSIDAPDGAEHDAEFTNRYMTHISTMLDELELFGVDIHRYRLSTSLSVAYIPLRVTSNPITHRHTSTGWGRGKLQSGEVDSESPSFQIERILRLSQRTLIRGEAGSGKTTLIAWLAVSASRSSLSLDLGEWNACVPYIVRLRSFVGEPLPRPEAFIHEIAAPLVELMPTGWAHRILATGRAVLLVDGVDELPSGERPRVRKWLKALLQQFPEVKVVVTARPSAAKHRWLEDLNFGSAILDRMGPSEVRALIAHWHEAISASGNSPCDTRELIQHERMLVSALDTAPHLQALATSPLLCAMLCALNLDRHSSLPPDRMGIYRAALEMLLERRDVERGVIVDAVPYLDIDSKLQILQYLAWRMSLNGRTELDSETAIRQISERVKMLALPEEDPKSILEYLTNRSSVVREVAPSRISFVHRTFQEYLTAREAAEQGDVGLLVDKAHLDTWRETVVMAAGHGNLPTRTALVEGILHRAEREQRYARRLRLLAAACVETAGPIAPELRSRVESHVRALVPPRTITEVQSLISAGPSIIHLMPDSITGLSVPVSRATIAAVALVGGVDALNRLAMYSKDPRSAIVAALIDQAKYFDPQEYGEKVLKNVEFRESFFMITDRAVASAIRFLNGATRNLVAIQRVQLHDVVDIAADIEGLPHIEALWLEGRFRDLAPVAELAPHLKSLTLWSAARINSFSPVSVLNNLDQLAIGSGGMFEDIQFVSTLNQLRELWVYQLSSVSSLEPLSGMEHLETLRLGDLQQSSMLRVVRDIPKLRSLYLVRTPTVVEVSRYAGEIEHIEDMHIWADSWLENLSPLRDLCGLKRLDIVSVTLNDLNGLQESCGLQAISLDCPRITDLSPLLRLPMLSTVRLNRPVEEWEINVFNEAKIDLTMKSKWD
ncbi:NACHT domain-containing protein [Nonomuraea sp. NPDC050540]|uniref:NACHT domain-containing protein n=1 Tax=Nonomuraea sp. NPDC050540 TaxID=3364367 RepID=UPI0037A5804F